MSIFKLPASRGVVALVASAVLTNFELLNTAPALHFSAIAVALGDRHAARLQVPSDIRSRLIVNVWAAVVQTAPQLSNHFVAFALFSAKATEIWRQFGDDAPVTYFDRHFSKTVEDVSLDEFMGIYDEFTSAFEERMTREEKSWRSGK